MTDNGSTINTKAQLLNQLEDARHYLWQCLDKIDETIEIYPGWQKREFFAHIAGWEAMVFDVFHAHICHAVPLDHGYTDLDQANERFVAVRQSTTLQDAKLECEINRFAIVTLLQQIEDYNDKIRFPWGIESVTDFIEGAIEHERSHAADIEKLNNASN